MSRKPALSPSSAREYLQCPYKFRLSHVDRIPQPPSEAMVKGTVVHQALEDLFDQPRDQRTLQGALELLPNAWEVTLKKKDYVGDLFDDEDALAAAKADTEGLLANYFRLEKPGNLEPKRTEQFLDLQLDSGIRVRGIADRIDQAPDGALRVVDYKTGKAPQPRFMNEALYQMRFYAMMLRHTWQLPRRLQLLYLRSVDVLTLDPNPQDIDRFEQDVENLWARIERDAKAARFETRTSRLCDWCAYQQICPAFGGEPTAPPTEGLEKLLTIKSPTTTE